MEQFKPIKKEVKKISDKEKKYSAWKKIKNLTEVAALAVLLSIQGINSTLAQEQGEKKDIKAKIEQFKERAANSIETIILKIKENGQAGNFNETPVRRWVSPDKKTSIIIGYDEKNNDKADWLIYEGKNSSMRLFDEGADGLVDRVVINNENTSYGDQQKSSENDLVTFNSIDNLAENAQVESSLDPQDMKVYEVNYENGEFVISSVDFQSGETAKLTGPDAEVLISKIQGLYTESLETVEDEISR